MPGSKWLGLPRHHVTTEMMRCLTVSYYREMQAEAGHTGAGGVRDITPSL